MPNPPKGVSAERLRVISVAARLYHVQDVRQRDIAERLGVSQARVSRLLQQAEDYGIVQLVLTVPPGMHPDLEEQLERGYGVTEVYVVEVPDGEDTIPTVLGTAAARFFSSTTMLGPVVGFTSWSTTLQAMARAFEEAPQRSGVRTVVEMLGDLGSPATQHDATRSTSRLAQVLGAEPVFLRTRGVVATPALRESAGRDGHVRRALDQLDQLDLAFVGIGPPRLHSMLRAGEGYFSSEQLAEAADLGAVGQLNQRFVDAAGRPVATALDQLVVGVSLEQLRRARRRVVVAGGQSKHAALAAALRGGWVDTLMTDLGTARQLAAGLGDPDPLPAHRPAQ